MAIFSDAVQLIKKFFKSKQRAVEELERRAAGLPYDEVAMFARYGASSILSSMFVPQTLLERYNDYEQMVSYPIIASALNIYADNVTIPDSVSGHRVWVECQQSEVKALLNHFLYKVIDIDNQIWQIVRNTCKYGNHFVEVLTDKEQGVVGIHHLPVASMRRITSRKGRLIGFSQVLDKATGELNPDEVERALREGKTTLGTNILWSPEQIVHFRIMVNGDWMLRDYGESILESVRWLWRRLLILEDSVIIYRLTRGPQKYIVYVDVGNRSPKEIKQYLEKIKAEFSKKKFIDPETGQLSTRYSPLASDENFFVAVQGEKDQTRIEALTTPVWDYLEDVNYFRDMLFAGLRIPRAYLSYDAEVRAKATLSLEDINFATTVLRIQADIINGLKQLCDLFLASKMIDPTSIDYSIRLTSPSQIYETMDMSIRTSRIELANAYRGWASEEWIMRNILKFGDDEIKQFKQEKEVKEKKVPVVGEPEVTLEPEVEVPVDRNIEATMKELDLKQESKLYEQLNAINRKLNLFGQALERLNYIMRNGRSLRR
jgi:hypothetical protein